MNRTHLQEDISAVMHDQDKTAYAEDVDDPRETHQEYRCDMVDEHLPEVLPFHIKELADAEGPVEGHGDHVVPPDVTAHRLMGESIPKIRIVRNTKGFYYIFHYFIFVSRKYKIKIHSRSF